MNKAIKNSLAAVAGATAIAGVVAVPALVGAWGDNSGRTDANGNLIGRELFTLDDADEGRLDGFITFNSFVKGRNGAALETGPETAFVGVQKANEDGSAVDPHGVWDNDITVEDGKEYVVRLYVHNNNPNAEAGMAVNTRVAVSIPSASSKANAQGKQEIEVNGFITADNAVPNRYWDYVRFNSNSSFHLEYVYGSAVIYNKGIGSAENGYPNGYPMPDTIYTMAAKPENGGTNGALIGFNALDGNVPGCYDYSSYITLRVKAVSDANYSISKQVRLEGEGKDDWRESVDAKVGDRVEFRINYQNTATKVDDQSDRQANVMIRDILPSNLKYVEGTTKLYNVSHPNGATLTPDGDLVTRGVNIGNYRGGSNAIVTFTAEVTDTDLSCGANTLTNWGQGTVNGIFAEDPASVNVNKVCETPEDPATPVTPETPTQLPNTGPMAVAGGIIAAGSVITAGGYFIASRRALH